MNGDSHEPSYRERLTFPSPEELREALLQFCRLSAEWVDSLSFECTLRTLDGCTRALVTHGKPREVIHMPMRRSSNFFRPEAEPIFWLEKTARAYRLLSFSAPLPGKPGKATAEYEEIE